MQRVRLYENLASDYYAVSLQALLDCADIEQAKEFEANLRQGILYGAFAAEAYVNAYIDIACPDQAKSLERAATLDKLLLSTRLTTGRDVFNRGAEPFQGLGALFGRRNQLVHHKPGFVTREMHLRTGRLQPRDRPGEVARYILAVAEKTAILDECLDEIGIESAWAAQYDLGEEIDIDRRDIEAWFVGEPVLAALDDEQYLRDLGKSLESGPPSAETPPPRDLLDRYRTHSKASFWSH